MEYVPANLENGPVIRNRKTDKKITNAVRLNDNRSVAKPKKNNSITYG